jgi:hypothetical protein
LIFVDPEPFGRDLLQLLDGLKNVEVQPLILPGLLPRNSAIGSSSHATRCPEIEVSATAARHSRLKSSLMHSTRNRWPQARLSDTKSRDQRWFGACGIAIDARVPSTYLRPPHLRTVSPA